MTFDRKVYQREYKRRPEVRARDKIHMKNFRSKPENKRHAKEYQRMWRKSPSGIEWYKKHNLTYQKQYREKPEIAEREKLRSQKKWMAYRWATGDKTTVCRKADYINGKSYCARCRISTPKRLWCPNCRKRMRMKSKYNKGEVHRY